MRLSSVILALLAAAGFAGAGAFLYSHTRGDRTWRELESLQGQDLARDLRLAERAALLLDRHVHSRGTFETWPQFAPFFVVRAESEVIVFQCATQSSLNSEAAPSGTAFIFTTDGSCVAAEPFSFGWSFFPGSPKVVRDPLLGADIIEFSSASRKGPIGRQFYALKGDQVTLLRMENPEGTLIPNRYDGHSAGAVPSEILVNQLELDLYQEGSVGVLASLLWLGGTHWAVEDIPPSQPRVAHHQASQIARLRHDPRIEERIVELTNSDHAWIREAAQWARLTLQN